MEEWLRLFLGEIPITPSPGQKLTDTEALKIAIREALRGYGLTSPNPAVGCVILDRNNCFLSSGYHERAGEAHAEIVALQGLSSQEFTRKGSGWGLEGLDSEKLKGARVFVTLEPCAFEGRTPSCAKTLASLPLSEVVVILEDPHPKVKGKGLALLREAGFEVRCFESHSENPPLVVEAARAVCEFFLVNQEQRPFVSLKVATSLDGIMALKNGESQWITETASRDFARFLRGAHEACLVGKNTILIDDPLLNARETPFADEDRALVILDLMGEVIQKPDLQIYKTWAPENILVCVGDDCEVLSSSQAQVLRVDGTTREEMLKSILIQLWEREIRSIWIEGGAETLSSAVSSGIGDRLWLFQGAHILGRDFGRSWTESWGAAQMKDRRTLDHVRHLSLGRDHLTTGLLHKSKT